MTPTVSRAPRCAQSGPERCRVPARAPGCEPTPRQTGVSGPAKGQAGPTDAPRSGLGRGSGRGALRPGTTARWSGRTADSVRGMGALRRLSSVAVRPPSIDVPAGTGPWTRSPTCVGIEPVTGMTPPVDEPTRAIHGMEDRQPRPTATLRDRTPRSSSQLRMTPGPKSSANQPRYWRVRNPEQTHPHHSLAIHRVEKSANVRVAYPARPLRWADEGPQRQLPPARSRRSRMRRRMASLAASALPELVGADPAPAVDATEPSAAITSSVRVTMATFCMA